MNLKAHTPALPRIDELSYDTLVLAHFADERPLRGVGGLVDWRLNGRLSRMLLSHKISGAWGEQLLYPQDDRLPFKWVLFFGLGDRGKFGSTRFKEITNRMLRTLMRLQCASFATALPGREALKLVPRQLIDLWLGELQKVFLSQQYNGLSYDIGFLEPRDVQGEISEQLDQFMRLHAPR